MTYPSGLTHNIGLDFMKRPYSLTSLRPGQNVAGPIIDSVAFNAADQVTQMSWPANAPFQGNNGRDYDATTYPAFTESRTYNSLNHVMQIQTQVGGQPSGMDLNYQYTAGQNNGQVDGLASGIDGNFNSTYSYDALSRLASVGGAKRQSYSYDGWGNLYSKTGDGTNFTVNVDAATNRPYGGGICYDPNGNLISVVTQCAPEYGYDIQNRLVQVAVSSNGKQDGSGHTDLSAEVYVYTAEPPYNPPPSPRPSPSPQALQCDIKVWSQSLMSNAQPFQHTSIELDVVDPNNSSNNSTVFVEGYNGEADKSQATPLESLLGNAYLDKSISLLGLYRNTTRTLLVDFANQSSLCDREIGIANRVNAFNDTTVRYGISGPNSNSFTFSLLNNVSLSIDSLALPGIALGWGQRVPGL